MERITRESVQGLLEGTASPAVTIYVPMHTTASPPHISENQLRFKNLVSKAAEDLERRDENSGLATELREMLGEHFNDTEFWKSQTPGLLICASQGNIKLFSLPIDTEEYVAVDEQYHLAPVLGLLDDLHEFYVLQIAQHSPKLLKGSLYGLEPAAIELPESVNGALNIDEPNQKSENQGSATGSSMNTGWFNGRGGARNPQEEDRMRFFRMIDKVLCDKLDRLAPVILSGITAEIAEYRGISKFPGLLEGAIEGNYATANFDELFPKASAIIWADLIQPQHQAAIEEYQNMSGANPDRVAHDKKSITEAAEQGRIDKLLAATMRNTTDTVGDTTEQRLRISFPDFSASQALNRLALKVWQMSGKVISLLPSEMPSGATMVARLRY